MLKIVKCVRKEVNVEKGHGYNMETLQQMAGRGVLLYQNDKLVEPWDLVQEEMNYMPEFIVVDEKGELKEIWY